MVAASRHRACPIGRIRAGEIEAAVIDRLRAIFRQPEIVAGTRREAAAAEPDVAEPDVAEAEVRDALLRLDPLVEAILNRRQGDAVTLEALLGGVPAAWVKR